MKFLNKFAAAAAALLVSSLLAFAATNMSIDGILGAGRIANMGGTPAVTTCGTSAALATGSTDLAGKITVGTTASNACTLTFSAAYTAAPFCVVQNLTTGAAANVYAVTTTTIIWSSALADSTVLHYHCIAPTGG